MSEKITGQIMTRPFPDGKVLIFGIIQVEEGSALAQKDGRQFVVLDQGTALEKNVIVNTINLIIPKGMFQDHDASGKRPEHLLTEPIWRV